MTTDILTKLSLLLKRYPNLYLIVSPPRCGSTALSRVFWEHPTIGYYSHEPFENTYYENKPLDDVYDKLAAPLDLLQLKSYQTETVAKDIVLKIMPYQVGDNFPLAASWAKRPIVFLMRDPRLNIQSRIKKKLETGDSPYFPLKETGWELIQQQIAYCQKEGIPYILVETNLARNHPEIIFPQVFERLQLDFFPEQLSWKANGSVNIDNLGGPHIHLYKKALSSKGLLPATEPIPALETFPEEHGIRAHVATCMTIYHELLEDENLIRM